MRYLVLLLLLAVPLSAAESESEKDRIQRVSAEVERRKLLREQAAAALENARKIVREHESGAKQATDAQLAAAREVIRQAEAKNSAPKAGESASLSLPDADMETVRTTWRTLFGESVTIAERAKSRVVSVKIPATSRDEIRQKLIAVLRENGVYVIEQRDGVIFDIQPEVKASK